MIGAISPASFAIISWGSSATWTGVGAKATANAHTSKTNDPYYYKMFVSARFNDGSSASRTKNNAAVTDIVNVNFTSTGAVSSGSSYHEWIMVGDSASVSKSMPIK